MKKRTTILITFALLAIIAVTAAIVAGATNNPATQPPHYMEEPIAEIDYDTTGQVFPSPPFMHFKGRITEIDPPYNYMGDESEIVYGQFRFVLLECDETGDMIRFMVDLTTAVLTELEEGKTVVGWFDSSEYVFMIWPPQHRAVAITAESFTHHTILDRFDENFASTDGVNTLEIADATEIVFQDGTLFDGELYELAGRKLLVEFYEEGRVIAPSKITVLFEVAIHPIHNLSDEELAEMDLFPNYSFDIGISSGPALLSPEDIEAFWASMFDPATVQIIVNDEVIEAATPFTDSAAGAIMLPVAAIAEALGYTVIDNGDEVIIAPGSILTAGENSYFRGREMPRQLTAAPVMVDDVMFVPWEFFHEILSGVAYVEDGNIHVVLQD